MIGARSLYLPDLSLQLSLWFSPIPKMVPKMVAYHGTRVPYIIYIKWYHGTMVVLEYHIWYVTVPMVPWFYEYTCTMVPLVRSLYLCIPSSPHARSSSLLAHVAPRLLHLGWWNDDGSRPVADVEARGPNQVYFRCDGRRMVIEPRHETAVC